ncbi:MAG: hypothetical protein KF914_03650 [Rhizobiaceae bacterium]|nr:hypothetical protein [Rhizobiaceae bacterium]
MGGHFSINAFGVIEPGGEARFHDFLERSSPPPRTTVYIDSSGGDVNAAIGIGRLIRAAWMHTAIGNYVLRGRNEFVAEREHLPGRCMSAATLIYLGGKLRYFNADAQFGVHQFSFRNPSPDDLGRSQILSAKIALYVVEMEVSPEFLELSSSVLSNQIKLVDEVILRRLKVVTGGETDVTWSVQGRAGGLYVRGERDSLYGHHKVMLHYHKGSGFLFHAVIEAQGRERELTTFPLVEIVVNGEDNRIDISQRALRTSVGIYVNVMCNLSQVEARMLAFSNSFGVQVRASNEAPVFLGIAAMSTEGGKEQLASFFETLCK